MYRWIVAVCLLLLLTGCAGMNVHVMGVDVSKPISQKDIGKAVLGAGASFLTHVAGHYLASEMVGCDLEFVSPFKERLNNIQELSDGDVQWVARGGFLLQAIVNTALTSLPSTKDTYFTKGYTAMTGLEVMTYPIRRSGFGDLDLLERYNGSKWGEYGLYSAVSIYNAFKISDWER